MQPAASTLTRLTETDKPALLAHFIALNAEDRRLRFGHAISDEGLTQYVGMMDLTRDGVFAACDIHHHIVAAMHVAIGNPEAEAGLSALPQARAQGLGTKLMALAIAFAKECGMAQLHLHFMADNQGMARLASKFNMQVSSSVNESTATLLLE